MADRDEIDRRQESLIAFGELVLRTDDLDAILTEGCRLVAEALDTPLSKIIQIEARQNTGLVRVGIGWNSGVLGHERVSLSDNTSEAFAIECGEPVVTQDVANETRFRFPQFLLDHGVRAIVNVPILLPGPVPWGLLQVDDRKPRDFGPEDIKFLKVYAMVLGPVIDRLQAVEDREEARSKLAQRETRLHRILSRMGEGFALLNPDYTIADLNREGLRMIGRPGGNLAGWPIWHVYPGSEQADVRQAFARAMEERVTATIEHEIFVTDRAPIWVEMRAYPNDDGTLAVFWRDITQRRASLEELQKNEQLLRSAIEVGEVGLWDLDIPSGTATWSERFIEMMGYSPGEVEPEYHACLDRIHPEDQEVEDAKVQVCMKAREDYSSRFRVIHPDGSVHWLRARARFSYDSAGEPVRMIGAAIDITEPKELHERQRVLVAELQHRTRNLIAVIRSIADKSGRYSADYEEFRAKFTSRLDALARAQGLLSRLAPDHRVAFDQLVKTEFAALDGGDTSSKFTLSGPLGVYLRSGSVQMIAMAMHELATNSLKYGALRQDGARLNITWALEEREGGGRPWLVVDWRESGVTMPDQAGKPQRSGQGRELIETALPYQLSARTSFELDMDGVHCTIAFPIAEDGARRDG